MGNSIDRTKRFEGTVEELLIRLFKAEKDAERYRWLRDRLAVEDIERLQHEFMGGVLEEESARTDNAVDAVLAALIDSKDRA